MLILGQDDVFNNFTQGGGKSNRSVVLAARVINPRRAYARGLR